MMTRKCAGVPHLVAVSEEEGVPLGVMEDVGDGSAGARATPANRMLELPAHGDASSDQALSAGAVVSKRRRPIFVVTYSRTLPSAPMLPVSPRAP